MLLHYLPKGKIAPASDESTDEDYALPEFLFHLSEIDVGSGLAHCGSAKSYMTTLKMYLDTAEKNADEIEKFWAARDIRNTTIKVHALKSTSRVIGALELGVRCKSWKKREIWVIQKRLEGVSFTVQKTGRRTKATE